MPSVSPAPEIVVTATRVEQALAACLARGCSVNDDARLSMALAERQFVAGRYRDARNALSASIGRTKAQAAVAPKPVAALYEAYATVLLHDGDEKRYRTALANNAEILREGLPADDPVVLAAALRLSAMWTQIGQPLQADRVLRGIERRLADTGQDRPAALVAIRRAWLMHQRGDRVGATEIAARIARGTAGRDPAIVQALAILRARTLVASGDDAAVLQAAALLRAEGGTRPVLLKAPFYANPFIDSANAARRFNEGVAAISPTSTDFVSVQWADIGFRIRPDGKVDDVQVLRSSRYRGWTWSAVEQIAARVYSSVPAPEGGQGSYRIERFTLRPTVVVPKGSLIARRAGPPELQVLDLTESREFATR